MFVSCVHPVAVLNAAFCMACSLLMLVEDTIGCLLLIIIVFQKQNVILSDLFSSLVRYIRSRSRVVDHISLVSYFRYLSCYNIHTINVIAIVFIIEILSLY